MDYAIPPMDLTDNSRSVANPRFLAFYLPQYYPTPYNDAWWGRGFTEWHNAVRARPRFAGHYQPHIPGDLGFYDLRLPQTRQAQAELAYEYGIHGFCYYHYWFNGKRVLEYPLDEVVRLGKPDFPFCICWANENWTRSWDGQNLNVLLEQRYSIEDDRLHIRQLLPTLADSRYIRLEGRPLVLIYRSESLPDPRQTTDTWRDIAIKEGLGNLFLVKVESNFVRDPAEPANFGFDASVRFQPNRWVFDASIFVRGLRALKSPLRNDRVFRYRDQYYLWKNSAQPPYRHFECVTPMWDNSARRARKAFTLRDSTPELYERWLTDAVHRSETDLDGHRWVFINAWNEWGEGCHLEPCQKWGRAYLEATRKVYLGGRDL